MDGPEFTIGIKVVDEKDSNSGDVESLNDELTTIVLPSRYRMNWVSKVAAHCENDHIADFRLDLRQSEQRNGYNRQNDLSDREDDLSTAIKWLRQEIILLKQQDKILMRKFLGLRSTIHQLQQRHLSNSFSGTTSQNSCMDAGSYNSIDKQSEHRMRGGLQTLSGSSLLPDTDLDVAFRRRSVSLLSPREKVTCTWLRKDRNKEIF